MSKFTPPNFNSLQNETSFLGQLNAAMERIKASFDNTLSRDGSTPNQMGADLDVNSNHIVNMAKGTQAGHALEFTQLQDTLDEIDADIQYIDGQVVIATAQANRAESEANDAENSAISAADNLATMEALLETYNNSFLGTFASNPTHDNSGNPLDVGDLYYNSVNHALMVYDGTEWQDVAAMTPTSINTIYNKIYANAVFRGTFTPETDDGAAIGTTALKFSDLFLATGAVINFNNGNITITHAANRLTFAGGTDGYYFSNTIAPTANDGAPLGSAAVSWSDLFLASGAVINFNAGDYTLTHSSGVLTANKDLRVTTVGTNSASVVTVGGTQTLTNKSINASSNPITNITTSMFATNVVDTDTTLSANSNTRIPTQKAVKAYVDAAATGSVSVLGLNVLGHGAVGDNSTDNVTAFTNTFTAASSAATGVYIPAGKYKIASAINIPLNVPLYMDKGAEIIATAVMDSIFLTTNTDVHLNNLIVGGKLNCNSNAKHGFWPKNFNNYRVQDVQVYDSTDHAINLGDSTASAPSYGFIGTDIFINRTTTNVTGKAGIYWENCGDSHLLNSTIIGYDYGTGGTANDSKFTNNHVWSYPPTHGNVTYGYYNLGVDVQYTGCQVDGPLTSGAAFYVGGLRQSILGCQTNNPNETWSNDNSSKNVDIAANCSATVIGCNWKADGGSHRWAEDIHVGSGATLNSLSNRSTNTVILQADDRANYPQRILHSSPYLDIQRYANDAFGSFLYLNKSRNATFDGHTIVQSGDIIGGITGGGSNGTSFVPAAQILFTVDGTPGASNDMPGAITFATTSDGAGSVTNRFRVGADGNFYPTTDGTGDLGTASKQFGNIRIASGKAFYINGVAQPPAGPTTIASGNLPAANLLAITDIPATYSQLYLKVSGASCDTATRQLYLQVSTNNGSSYDTTATSYVGFNVADTGTMSYLGVASLIKSATVAAANTFQVGVSLLGYNSGHYINCIGRVSNGTNNYAISSTYVGGATVNAIRLIWDSTGNFDAGTYSLVGIA